MSLGQAVIAIAAVGIGVSLATAPVLAASSQPRGAYPTNISAVKVLGPAPYKSNGAVHSGNAASTKDASDKPAKTGAAQ